MRLALLMLALAGVCATAAQPAAGQALTQAEALRLAFPGDTDVQRHTAYLEPARLVEAKRLAGSDVEVTQRVVTYYVGRRAGQAVGAAYFDSHRVRTMPEVVMVVVNARGTVERVEIMKFAEPPEYRAPERWLAQVEGKALTPELSLRRGVVNLTGATLTATAITRAVRRVLALHAVIRPFEVEK